MSLRLVVGPQAQDDLLAARDWYEAQRPGLGELFVSAVDAVIGVVLERPTSCPRVRGEIRRAVIRRFPYGVYSQVLDREIVILGVVHGHRDPRVWQSRH